MARLPLAAPLLFVALPAFAQSAVTDPVLAPRPATPLRVGGGGPLAEFVPADSLSDDQLARRLARLYERQAAILDASADGDQGRTARLLDALVADLQLLGQRPGVMFDARFREAYSAVLTEHERFYGEPALDRGDVYAFREAGVDAVERGFDMGVPLLDHVTLPDRSTYATTIPMDVNTQVERYLQFLVRRPSHVERLLSRSETYLPMIERVLAEEGVPDELKYLAMVESALNPAAQSHMAAAGMWQFIRATGAAYGLQATREYDDRLDPERSTRAAARHLRDLYDRFGDWQLALAGYNCNPAVIARAAARFEERTGRRATFWDIESAIPRETRAYVPMFIATSLVVSNPSAYGIAPTDDPGPEYVFDRMPAADGTSLGAVARALGVSEAAVRALNPSLRSGRVPSGRGPQTLRIPPGLYAGNAAELERFAPAGALRASAETVSFGPRAVRPVAPQERGEALRVAAVREQARPGRRPATPVVRRDNPVDQYAAVAPPEVAAFEREQARAETRTADRVAQAEDRGAQTLGREALIAARAALVAEQTGESVAETPAEEVAETVPAPAATAAPVLVARAAPAPPVETPPATARRAAPAARPAPPVATAGLLGPDVAALAQTRPPAPARTAAPAPAVRETREARVPVRVVSDRAERRPTSHVVARGEYLATIARQYGVTVQQLRQWNEGVDGDRLFAGRRLVVSAEAAPARRTRTRAAAPAPPPAPRSYTVRSGDNLTRIARQTGVSIRDLQQWNGITNGNVRAGQTLRLQRPTRG